MGVRTALTMTGVAHITSRRCALTLSAPRRPLSRVRIIADDRFSSCCQRWSAGCTSTDAVGLQAHGRDAAERVADRDAPRDLELALRHRPCRNNSVSARGTTDATSHACIDGESISDLESHRSVTLAPMRLVLASASPRRADLLRAAGIPFDMLPVDVDERFAGREAGARGRAPGRSEGRGRCRVASRRRRAWRRHDGRRPRASARQSRQTPPTQRGCCGCSRGERTRS